MRTAFGEEGDLRATDVLAALVTLWREGASGSVHFSRSGATAGFLLADGELTSVTSSEARFETASILLRAGKLDAATLDRLSTPQGGDRAFAALQAGILTKREWRWGEKIRAVEVLSDLLTWIEGDYVFDRGAAAAAGEFRLTVPRLVLELFLRSRDRSLVLHHLGGVDVPLVRAPHFDAEFTAFGLTADAEAVVRLIDGKATAAQISSEGTAEPFAVEKLLAALVTLGLVHPEFALAETPSGPAAAEDGERAADYEEAAAEEEEEEEESGDLSVPPEASSDPRGLDLAEADLGTEPSDSPDPDDEEESAVDSRSMHTGEEEFNEPRISAPARHAGASDELESPLDGAVLDRGGSDAEPEEEPARADTGALRGDSFSAPAFDGPLNESTGVGSTERPRARSAGPWLWLLVLLGGGVAAVILLRSHGSLLRAPGLVARPSPTATLPAAAVEPTLAPSPVAAVPLFPPSPPASAPRSRPTRAPAPTARVPAPSPRPAAAATPPRVGAHPAAEAAPGGSRAAWLERAARDRQRASADKKTRYAVQVELACEIPSLVDAWKYDRPAGSLWVLATPFQGKTCFRVLWGRYPTRDAAHRAVAKAPAFFTSARNRPVVAAVP